MTHHDRVKAGFDTLAEELAAVRDNPPVGQDIGLAINQRVMKTMRDTPVDTGLGGYYPYFAQHNWNPHLSVYNWRAENTRQIAAGRARARNGGNMHGVFFGDSLLIGTGAGGVTATERKGIPRQAQRIVGDALGVPMAGGISPAVAAPTLRSDRWTGNGALANTYAYLSNTQTHTYTSLHKGTNIDMYISELGCAGTYTIDGGTPVVIAAGNSTNTVRKISITNQTDTVHEVKFTSSGGANVWLFVLGVEVWSPHGTRFHNLALGGGHAAGTHANSFTDAATSGSAYYSRKIMFDASGISPDFVFCDLGGNDISNAYTTAQIKTALETIIGWYPNADVILMGAWEKYTTEVAAGKALMKAKFELADTYDCILFDYRHRYINVDKAEAVAYGLTASDTIHPHDGTAEDMSHPIAQLLAGDGPGFPRMVTNPGTLASVAHLPNQTVVVEYTP